MDEFRLLELKEFRDKIIKKHLIIIIFGFILSSLLTLIYFLKLKYNSKSLFLILLFIINSPIYIFFLLSEKQPKNKYQYSMGITLVIIFCYSSSVILFAKTLYYHLFLYFITLCIYHYAEFFSELFFHFKDLQKDAFLIYENKKWVVATLSSFLEYIIEAFLFYRCKEIKILFLIGLIMTIVGQYFRIAALFTGKYNFTHKIQMKKRKNHVLVKHGIYSLSRHPSYFGFFLWSVGIEIMCINPLCIIIFSFVLFKFFKNRIEIEEKYLIRFFGMEYIKYRKEVGILIPFIDINKEIERKNLQLYLEEHEDERNNKEIANFLNDEISKPIQKSNKND